MDTTWPDRLPRERFSPPTQSRHRPFRKAPLRSRNPAVVAQGDEWGGHIRLPRLS
jgi:hypothetical protein